MISIDWTISLGNIITVIGVFVGGAWFASKLDTRLTAVEKIVGKITDILEAVSSQEAKIDAVNTRIGDLPCRRGGGEFCPDR